MPAYEGETDNEGKAWRAKVCCDGVGLRLIGLPANVRQLTSAPGLPVSVVFFQRRGEPAALDLGGLVLVVTDYEIFEGKTER